MKSINKCVHFTGVQNKTCKAGVNYDVFPSGVPCIKDLNRVAPSQGVCDKYLEPTPDEIAADGVIRRQHMERMGKVMAALAPIRKEQKGKNWCGVIVCPACGGKLHLSHAAYNGHMHGQCETKNCVAWME